jgi:hypothetical protein
MVDVDVDAEISFAGVRIVKVMRELGNRHLLICILIFRFRSSSSRT